MMIVFAEILILLILLRVMFKKFTAFWIEHAKLTWLFIIATLAIGIFSWFTIAKQYNPDIVVPAFQITVPTP